MSLPERKSQRPFGVNAATWPGQFCVSTGVAALVRTSHKTGLDIPAVTSQRLSSLNSTRSPLAPASSGWPWTAGGGSLRSHSRGLSCFRHVSSHRPFGLKTARRTSCLEESFNSRGAGGDADRSHSRSGPPLDRGRSHRRSSLQQSWMTSCPGALRVRGGRAASSTGPHQRATPKSRFCSCSRSTVATQRPSDTKSQFRASGALVRSTRRRSQKRADHFESIVSTACPPRT